MNGNRYVLDTNAIIAFLQGNTSVRDLLSKADWIGTSVICVLEFYSFPAISAQDKLLLDFFITKINLINVPADRNLLAEIAKFKIRSKLKLPDAIIAYAAIHQNAALISNDKDFASIDNVLVISFE